MSNHNQLRPCNKCWSEAEHRVNSLYQCSNPECGRHRWAARIHQWNAANPISHAALWIAKRETEHNLRHANYADVEKWQDSWRCKHCAAFFEYYDEEDITKLALSIQHDPTCPLITDAKLALKVKGE